jgi:hypothetical protein
MDWRSLSPVRYLAQLLAALAKNGDVQNDDVLPLISNVQQAE